MTDADRGREVLDDMLANIHPRPVALPEIREQGDRWRRRRLMVSASVAAAVVVIAGVGVTAGAGLIDSSPDPAFNPAAAGEYDDAGGRVCPDKLPRAEDSDGQGTEDPAQTRPNLRAPDRVWVCQYAPKLGGNAPDGRIFNWLLKGGAQQASAADVEAFTDALNDIAPGDRDPELPCPADLGSRWMIVGETAGDLTGYVIDDFGCRNLRITDDPRNTEPGVPTQAGTVPGTFRDGVAGLLTLAKQHWIQCVPASCRLQE